MQGVPNAAGIDRDQIKSIYAMGRSLGIAVSGSHDDELHSLVGGLTGRESIKDLTHDEAAKVISELRFRMRGHVEPPPARKPPSGGMTDGQRRKVWRLMYRLADLDTAPSDIELGARLCGVIKHTLKIDATQQNPFRWISYRKGSVLIEALKGMVANAERRKAECPQAESPQKEDDHGGAAAGAGAGGPEGPGA